MSERRSNPQEHADAAKTPLTRREIFDTICAHNPNLTPAEKIEVAKRLGFTIVRRPSHRTPADASQPPASRPTDADDAALTAIMDAVMQGLPPETRGPQQQSGDTGHIDLDEAPYNEDDAHGIVDRNGRLRLRNLNPTQRLMVVGATAVGLAITGVAVGVAAHDPHSDTVACADQTHTSSEQGETLQGVATRMETERGYHIDPERVLNANHTVTNIHTGETVSLKPDSVDASTEILKDDDARFCFVVPAPIALGQQEASGALTLAQIAENVGQSVATLRALNADRVPKDNNQPIAKGTIIWLSKDLDLSLILRRFNGESLHALTGDNPDLIQALADANIFRFGEQDALELREGEEYYLPYANSPATPAMKALGVTPVDILRAYKTQLTYATRNQAIPSQQPQPTATAEVAAAPHRITEQQRTFIESLNLNETQKSFFINSVDTLMQLQTYAQDHNINMTVMFAQAILESSYGESEKAELFHNYFGMKTRAGDGWTGQDTGARYPEGKYRIFESMTEGYRGYIDNISSSLKPWYDDAQAHYQDYRAYLAGLLNTDNGDYAYAEDPNYEAKILGIISEYKLDDLIKLGLAAAPTPEATPAPAEIAPNQPPGNIVLDPSKYENNPRQSELPPNNSKYGTRADGTQYRYDPNLHQGPWLIYHNKLVLSSQLTYEQRLEMVQDALNGVHPTVEGLNAFKPVDVRAKVMADPHLVNFHGTVEDRATPNVHQDIKFFVWHFTATNTSATSYDGYKAAGAMQNGGRHVGIQYYQDSSGTAYHLTDKMTYQVLNDNGVVYNHLSYGMEIAACEQAAISSNQYTTGIYLTAQFLIDNKFIVKGTPITATVRHMVKGHHEANPNGHDDNPGIVMDQVRALLIKLLVEDGYTA